MSGNTIAFDLVAWKIENEKQEVWCMVTEGGNSATQDTDWWNLLTPLFNQMYEERLARTKNPPKRVKSRG